MLQKNPYFLKIFLSLILFLVITGIFNCPVFSQNVETITISTYYPSPVGVYRELRAQRQAIGDNYYNASQYCWPPAVCANPIDANADLVVEGNVGIGTVTPQRMLHVSSPNGLLARIENTGDGYDGEVNTAVLEIKNHRAGADTHRAVNFLDRWDYPVGQVAFNGDHVTGTSMWIHGARPGDTRVAPYADMVLDANGNVGIGTVNPQARLDVSGNAILFPRNADDPAGVNGMMYYNTASNNFRVFRNGAWGDLGSGVQMVSGSYTGNGAVSLDVNVGFQPKSVIIIPLYTMPIDGAYWEDNPAFKIDTMIVSGHPGYAKDGEGFVATDGIWLTATGFKVGHHNAVNGLNRKYSYIAFTW